MGVPMRDYRSPDLISQDRILQLPYWIETKARKLHKPRSANFLPVLQMLLKVEKETPNPQYLYLLECSIDPRFDFWNK